MDHRYCRPARPALDGSKRQRTPTIRTDACPPAVKVSPTLDGLMTDHINHAHEDGIYGELVQNRFLKDSPMNPTHWSLLQDRGAMGTMALDTSGPMNEALTTSLRVTVDSAGTDGKVS